MKREKENKIDAIPSKVLQVGSVPLTRLAMSDDGNFLAIGGSDGKVTLVNSQTMKTVC